MPTSPPHACIVPGCPRGVLHGEGAYCEEHKPVRDEGRGNRHQRGYGNAWAKVSRYYLARHPICCDPYGRHAGRVVAATQTDHIIPKAQGGTNEESNLQGLCRSCHTYKTFNVERVRGVKSSEG